MKEVKFGRLSLTTNVNENVVNKEHITRCNLGYNQILVYKLHVTEEWFVGRFFGNELFLIQRGFSKKKDQSTDMQSCKMILNKFKNLKCRVLLSRLKKTLNK